MNRWISATNLGTPTRAISVRWRFRNTSNGGTAGAAEPSELSDPQISGDTRPVPAVFQVVPRITLGLSLGALGLLWMVRRGHEASAALPNPGHPDQWHVHLAGNLRRDCHDHQIVFEKSLKDQILKEHIPH